MRELGMKSRVFIYYITTLTGKQTTCKCIKLDKADAEKYVEIAKEKLTKRFGREPQRWMLNAESAIMADEEAEEARTWLVANGYLFENVCEKYNGGMKITYTGVTRKGWEVAPKYLALVNKID